MAIVRLESRTRAYRFSRVVFCHSLSLEREFGKQILSIALEMTI